MEKPGSDLTNIAMVEASCSVVALECQATCLAEDISNMVACVCNWFKTTPEEA